MYFFSLKFKCFIVLKEYIFTIYLKWIEFLCFFYIYVFLFLTFSIVVCMQFVIVLCIIR